MPAVVFSIFSSNPFIDRRMKCMSDMTHRAREVQAAAEAIHPAALDEAKAAIATSCREYLRWAGLFSLRLQSLPDGELHRFARAFSLTLLGHLPTHPGTCPFCIQYGKDRSCSGCGYAATHGRCDEDDSAFSVFIEAFQELGRMIFQDTISQENISSPEFFDRHAIENRRDLHFHLNKSMNTACRMEQSLPPLTTLQLMEAKQIYIGRMIDHIPISLFSDDGRHQFLAVKDSLMRYW